MVISLPFAAGTSESLYRLPHAAADETIEGSLPNSTDQNPHTPALGSAPPPDDPALPQATDAGQTCIDSSQCQGLCVFAFPENLSAGLAERLAQNRPVSGMKGQCSANATKAAEGCVYEIEEGVLQPLICF